MLADRDRASIDLSAEERMALREARDASQALNLVALGAGDVEPGCTLPLQVRRTHAVPGRRRVRRRGHRRHDLRSLAIVKTLVGKSITVTSAARFRFLATTQTTGSPFEGRSGEPLASSSRWGRVVVAVADRSVVVPAGDATFKATSSSAAAAGGAK